MDNLLALWQQRTRRERHLLLGMGVMLLIGLIYYALWQPWQNREAQWRQTLAGAVQPAVDAPADPASPAA